MKIALIIALILAGQVTQSLAGEKEGKKSFETCCTHDEENHREFEEQLENLRVKLKLTSEQEVLWKAWSAQIQKAHEVMEDFRRGEHSRRALPAPERQEKWMRATEDHLARMRESLADLKSLYEALIDGQRKIFDAEVPFKRSGH